MKCSWRSESDLGSVGRHCLILAEKGQTDIISLSLHCKVSSWGSERAGSWKSEGMGQETDLRVGAGDQEGCIKARRT